MQRCPTFIIMDIQTKIFFATNVVLITVSLFSWIIKWFYRPKAYREHFDRLFPGQFYVGLLFLLQILEVPYLFDISDGKVLRYVNAFSLLLAPPIMLLICRKFFFPKKKYPRLEIAFFIPAIILFIVFLLRITGAVSFDYTGRQIIIWSSFVVFLSFFYQNIRMALKIGEVSRAVEKMEYADEEDFPVNFASYVQWVPTLICVIIAINYLCHDPWIKFFTDLFSIVFTVIFVMFTLDPWREIQFVEEEQVLVDTVELVDFKQKRRLSDSRYEQLRESLFALFEEKKIYLTPHLSLEVLLKEMSTNRNYLSETIARSGYKSFYNMVNAYRVKYAINIIKEEPMAKMLDVAIRSGFSSATSMNKAFVQQGLPTPSQHREITPAQQ